MTDSKVPGKRNLKTSRKRVRPYRQTPAEDRQEINAIRKYGETPQYRSRYGRSLGDKTGESGMT